MRVLGVSKAFFLFLSMVQSVNGTLRKLYSGAYCTCIINWKLYTHSGLQQSQDLSLSLSLKSESQPTVTTNGSALTRLKLGTYA